MASRALQQVKDSIRTLQRPPRITCLEAGILQIPKFSFPHRYTAYRSTQPSQVAARLRDSDTAIIQLLPISAHVLARCPSLRLIVISAVGTDEIDMAECRRRGITVCNVPLSSTESVTEHAFGQYFALRRRLLDLDQGLRGESFSWASRSSTYPVAPRGCREETLGIIGLGALGRNVSRIGSALGMRVLHAERKGVPETETRPSRTPFAQVLRESTLLIITCPLTKESRHMINEDELHSMRQDAILVNVGRGAVVVERALATALRQGWIQGAALDVFEVEPFCRQSSPLFDAASPVPNLLLSPHVAWYSRRSLRNMEEAVKGHVEAFWRGEP